MPLKLTKRTVDAITPGDRASIVYDTDLKGFGVRIAADRSLSWFVEYRPGGGGRRVAKKRMVIGSREFTPEQARQAAKGILAAISLGSGEERKSDTFHEFAERYLREEAEAKLKVGRVVNYRICVRKHTVPEIGSIKLNRISTADISRIHTKVGQTRRPRTGLSSLSARSFDTQPPAMSCRLAITRQRAFGRSGKAAVNDF